MASIVNDNGNNHSFNTAQNVTINNVVSGSINALGEVDHYKITFDGNGEVEFILTAPETAEYALTLYKSTNSSNALSYGSSDGNGHISLKYNVTAGTTYIVRITINGTNYNTNYALYSLRFNPTVATNIELGITNGTEISYNTLTLSHIKTPSNAYAACTYTASNNNVSINSGSITPRNDGVAFISVFDSCSGITDNKFVIINRLPSSHAISIPTDRRCNWNQKHSGVTSIFGRKACTLVAGLDVANIYSTNSSGYTPSDMNSSTYWDSIDGYKWTIPGPGQIRSSYTFVNDSPSDVDESIKQEYILQGYIRFIKNEIYNGRPVIINLGPNSKNNHSVVAYKYMNTPQISTNENPTEMNKIMVYDPENGGNESDIEGRNVTLWEAFRYNFISNSANSWKTFAIWSLRPTSL